MTNVAKNNKTSCRHDYKNAVQIGNVDYLCPLCEKLLDPGEWFLMNSFEFIDVSPVNESLSGKRSGSKITHRSQTLPPETKQNYL